MRKRNYGSGVFAFIHILSQVLMYDSYSKILRKARILEDIMLQTLPQNLREIDRNFINISVLSDRRRSEILEAAINSSDSKWRASLVGGAEVLRTQLQCATTALRVLSKPLLPALCRQWEVDQGSLAIGSQHYLIRYPKGTCTRKNYI